MFMSARAADRPAEQEDDERSNTETMAATSSHRPKTNRDLMTQRCGMPMTASDPSPVAKEVATKPRPYQATMPA